MNDRRELLIRAAVLGGNRKTENAEVGGAPPELPVEDPEPVPVAKSFVERTPERFCATTQLDRFLAPCHLHRRLHRPDAQQRDRFAEMPLKDLDGLTPSARTNQRGGPGLGMVELSGRRASDAYQRTLAGRVGITQRPPPTISE